MNIGKHNLPLVTVGIPTRNRPDGLASTIHDIANQTYSNVEILVSDNSSTEPAVLTTLEEAKEKFPQIRVFRHNKNIGPAANFQFLFNQASGKFFMWAADDDSWEPTFIEEMVQLLIVDKDSSFAFCDFAVDFESEKINYYPDFFMGFSTFSNKSTYQRMKAYILQGNSCGKANPIYGLYHIGALNSIQFGTRSYFDIWGGDMVTVLAVLGSGNMSLSSKKLFTKRLSNSEYLNAKLGGTGKVTVTRAFKRLHELLSYCFAQIFVVLRTRNLNAAEKVKLCGMSASRMFKDFFESSIKLAKRS